MDPDQLASKKPADLDAHCFLLCEYILNVNKKYPTSLLINYKMERSVVHT